MRLCCVHASLLCRADLRCVYTTAVTEQLLNISGQDNRTPPGFAVVHDSPHQLIATLA